MRQRHFLGPEHYNLLVWIKTVFFNQDVRDVRVEMLEAGYINGFSEVVILLRNTVCWFVYRH